MPSFVQYPAVPEDARFVSQEKMVSPNRGHSFTGQQKWINSTHILKCFHFLSFTIGVGFLLYVAFKDKPHSSLINVKAFIIQIWLVSLCQNLMNSHLTFSTDLVPRSFLRQPKKKVDNKDQFYVLLSEFIIHLFSETNFSDCERVLPSDLFSQMLRFFFFLIYLCKRRTQAFQWLEVAKRDQVKQSD